MPRGHHLLVRENPETPKRRKHPPDFSAAAHPTRFRSRTLKQKQSMKQLTLMLCFLFACTLVRAENLLYVGLVNQ